jgi:L,D-transpeptidase catalytic domain/Putative peptidoglycan binding domain
MMSQSVRRWLFGAGAIAVIGGTVLAQTGTASAAQISNAAPHLTSHPTVAGYEPAKRVLRMGDHGPLVKRLQRRLRNLHYYPGPADGKFGQDTIEAVWAFMSAQGTKLTAKNSDEVSLKMQAQLVNPKLPKVLIKHGPANRVEINQNDELLVLYKHNKPVLMAHVSTGAGCVIYPGCWYTPNGNYTTYAYTPGWVKSNLCPTAAGCMFNPVWWASGYAIHGDPSVPYYPDSHGCVRVWMDISYFFHKLVHIGGKHATPVYIRGTAPYL